MAPSTGPSTGQDSSLLRRINSAVTLRVLYDGTPRTVTELMGATGLSRPTVEGVVDGLIADGLVTDTGPGAADGARRRGRPARRLRFRSEAGHLLGVDIGTSLIRLVLADLTGTVVARLERPVAGETPAGERLESVRAGVAALLRRAGVARDDLWAVGAGTPGIVDSAGRVSLCSALPGWTGLDLAGTLGRWFSCPVTVENDANLAAIGERWRGVAAGADDVVYVLAGLSPGAGSLINGRIHRGFGGAAGEIGALHLLGRQASPESLLSTTGTPLVPLDEAAVTRVFAGARAGDPVAAEAVDRFVDRLVHDIAALVLALDPEVVVVGGWAAGLDDVLGPLRTRLARFCLRPPRVDLAALGGDGVALGALRVALDRAGDRLFAALPEGAARG